ncbi:hypothetical protein DM860_015723 [Cuscuta australis]|uniref:RING-type domain-containing protein n=2 Tax=Cuscuta sect. Cleistogrammica TaxID=1824901 RepID=A0A328DRA4_9ASTE|nr:hypothetical protein DM860_015723 [Cuscuta australis]
MDTGGGGFRRRMMETAEQKLDSPNLGDFLRVKEGSNANGGSDSVAGLTLGAVLGREPRSATAELPNHRTLLDIIRAEPFASKGNRKTWKQITDRLCLRIPVSAWSCVNPDPHALDSDIPLRQSNRWMGEESHPARVSAANSSPQAGEQFNHESIQQPELTTSPDSTTLILLLQRSSSRAVGRGSSRLEVAEAEASGEGTGDQPARLSLMTLLAETDREMGLDGAAYLLEEEEGEAEEEIAAAAAAGNVDQCCVCMIRHKGAAFIPCGHTFCRRCSRELWVQRGSCPLCNNSISEVLDIF